MDISPHENATLMKLESYTLVETEQVLLLALCICSLSWLFSVSQTFSSFTSGVGGYTKKLTESFKKNQKKN